MASRKPGFESVIVSEYRLINALIKNPSYLNDSRISEEVFVSEIAKSLYEAIEYLYSRKEPITEAALLQRGLEIDYNVSKDVVRAVFEIDNEGAKTLDDIFRILNQEKTKMLLREKVENLKQSISNAGDINQEDFLKSLYDIDEIYSKETQSSSSLKSFEEWSKDYLDDLEARKEGRKYSYGDYFLDKDLFKGAYPGAITVIAGTPGQGKSTFALSLIDNLLEQNSPCMYISLEMGSVDTFDRLLAKKVEIPSDQLYNPEMVDSIIEGVNDLRSRLSSRRNFYFVEDPDISVAKLKSMIREFKQRTRKDYCLVVIDLLTQMKGFLASSSMKGAGTPQTIENSMNELNALAKSENVHIIGVCQFRRDSDSGKVFTLQDISNLRPTLNDVKNSGAIAERARVVMSVFRPKYYADRYLPDDDPEVQTLEDIMEVQILKNSSGEAGKIYEYMYDGKYFKLTPLVEEEKDEILGEDI